MGYVGVAYRKGSRTQWRSEVVHVRVSGWSVGVVGDEAVDQPSSPATGEGSGDLGARERVVGERRAVKRVGACLVGEE